MKMISGMGNDQNDSQSTNNIMKLEEAKACYFKAYNLAQETLGDQHGKTQKVAELLSNVNSYRIT